MNLQKEFASAVKIPADGVMLEGDLIIPAGATGIVIFAHGSGSSRLSPRNKSVAGVMRQHKLGTLLFDLLTAGEEQIDIYSRHLRFDIELLANRLVAATKWLDGMFESDYPPIGFFGASTGGGAALVAAAKLGKRVGAVVSRGGRPDLAGAALSRAQSPVLLIVGGADEPVIELNEQAYAALRCEKELKIVPGATHLFEEPGALETVAETAAEWFARHFQTKRAFAG